MNLKFFDIQITGHIGSIFSSVSMDKYSDENAKGFVIDKFINEKIIGRFIYKKIFDVVTKDPFGNELTNEQIIYEIFNFIIDSRNNLLILYDAPKSLKLFLSSLSIASGYKITIDQFKCNLFEFYQFIAKKSQKISLNSIEIDKLQIAGDVNVRLTITGGQDIEKYISTATYNKKKYEVKLLKFKSLIDGLDISVIVTSSCQIKSNTERMNDAISNKIIDLFGEFIITQKESQKTSF